MRLDVQARGFTLTAALRSAVESEASSYERRFPHLNPSLHVRLFDVNGRRGGIDKGCLVEARVGHRGTVLVSSDLDSDLYRAIPAAFEKLERSTQAALNRRKAARSLAQWPPFNRS